jgi:hypothetical protein
MHLTILLSIICCKIWDFCMQNLLYPSENNLFIFNIIGYFNFFNVIYYFFNVDASCLYVVLTMVVLF